MQTFLYKMTVVQGTVTLLVGSSLIALEWQLLEWTLTSDWLLCYYTYKQECHIRLPYLVAGLSCSPPTPWDSLHLWLSEGAPGSLFSSLSACFPSWPPNSLAFSASTFSRSPFLHSSTCCKYIYSFLPLLLMPPL